MFVAAVVDVVAAAAAVAAALLMLLRRLSLLVYRDGRRRATSNKQAAAFTNDWCLYGVLHHGVPKKSSAFTKLCFLSHLRKVRMQRTYALSLFIVCVRTQLI